MLPKFLCVLTRLAVTTAPRSLTGKFQFIVTSFLTHFTYPALVLVLILASVGVPIPEDIPLVFSGFLCNKDHSPINQITKEVDTNGDGVMEVVHRQPPHLSVMIFAGMVGVLVGDILAFSIGRRGIDSNTMIARHIRKVMHTKRREKVESHFARHGNLTVFAGRFMPGFRAIVFAFAGMSKMSFVRFIIIDGIAAAISVPFFIWLGYYFADRLEYLFTEIDKVKHIVLPVLVAMLAIAAILFYLRRRKPAAATTPENL